MLADSGLLHRLCWVMVLIAEAPGHMSHILVLVLAMVAVCIWWTIAVTELCHVLVVLCLGE